MFTVLLVEDEELERRYLKSLFEESRSDYRVIGEACNGKEGIELCLQLQPDIVFMDIRMPGVDGLTATKVIKSNHPETRILLLSAYDDFNYARQAIHLGVSEYLLKPAQPEEIFEALNSMTNKAASLNRRFSGFFSTIDPKDFASEHYPFEKEKEIITALEMKDYKLFNKATDDLIQELINNCRSIHIIKARTYELITVITRFLTDDGYSFFEMETFKVNKFREIEELSSFHDLKEYLTKFKKDCLKLIDLNETSSAGLAEIIVSYINTHKAENLSLKDLASRFHFSPCHISRLIRKKTGQTFPQYLNKIRLAEAKELLRNSDLEINKIAYTVGYTEVSHFNRIFKKTLGLSPSKYRRLFTESKPTLLENH